jgi:hypothetical protein
MRAGGLWALRATANSGGERAGAAADVRPRPETNIQFGAGIQAYEIPKGRGEAAPRRGGRRRASFGDTNMGACMHMGCCLTSWYSGWHIF